MAHGEDLTTHIERREASDWRTPWTALRPDYEDLTGPLDSRR